MSNNEPTDPNGGTRQIAIPVYSVVMLVGPSGCGKTTLSKTRLIPALRAQIDTAFRAAGSIRRANVQHVSSDELRRELLGDASLGKNDRRMAAASGAAFALLREKLRLVTAYPQRAHFVVVDTTGLSPEFRSEVLAIARDAAYSPVIVAFDYKSTDEYERLVPRGELDRKLIHRHVKRFRADFLPSLKRRDWEDVIKIRSKDFDGLNFIVKDLDRFQRNILDERLRHDVIADVHGCLEETLVLLRSRGYSIGDDLKVSGHDDSTIVMVGDLIDKGPDSKAVLRFVEKNRDRIKVVLGNHENFVHKWLSGKIKDGVTDEFRKSNFSATEEFKHDDEAKALLAGVVENSHEFLEHADFIVTHAPCEARFLGKLDRASAKAQNRTSNTPRRRDFASREDHARALERHLSFLARDAESSHPLHVFGHLNLKAPLRLKNKICVDTGCVGGGGLTLLSIDHAGGIRLHSVPSPNHHGADEERPEIFASRSAVQQAANGHDRRSVGGAGGVAEPVMDVGAGSTAATPGAAPAERSPSSKTATPSQPDILASLSPDERRRVARIVEARANFIPGTIAPADKDAEGGILESMGRALAYFRRGGVADVVIQPKYMGSRVTVYLTRDVASCRATTRGGLPVPPGVDMLRVYERLLARLSPGMREGGISMLVVDGELMPWRALGAGLIDLQYAAVEAGVLSEIAALRATGFEDVLKDALSRTLTQEAIREASTTKREALIKAWGHHRVMNFDALRGLDVRPFSEHEAAIAKFAAEIKTHGSPGEIHMKPFSVLKAVFEDGREVNHMAGGDADNEALFRLVSDDQVLRISLADPDAVAKAEEFFARLTVDARMEGVVVKPLATGLRGVAGAIKVRSPDYLHIVYGYDYLFPAKLARLIERKRVGRKLRLSIEEAEIGRQLLDIKVDELTPENPRYVELVARMVAGERDAEEIDPRL